MIKKVAWAGIILALANLSQAAELMSTADVIEGGKWSFSFYGRSAESEPVLKLTDNNVISSGSNAELDVDQSLEEAVAAIKFRPHNGLTYRVKAGQVRNFDIEFSSGSHTNKFEATSTGLVWGLGAEWNVAPGSIVSPAVTMDASWTQRLVTLDRFQAPGVVQSVDDRFQQDEIQLALNISKRWKKVEPFAGLKVSRVISTLKDQTTKSSLRGVEDGVSPFVGIALEFFDAETLMLEASFLDEESINAGLNVRF